MWRGTTLILLGVVLVGGGCVLSRSTTKTTVAQTEKQLDRDIPTGSTRADVEAWLKGKGIESSYTEGPDAHYSSIINEEVPDTSAYKGVTAAIIRDTDQSFLVTGSIQIYFLYGPDGRLAKRIVRWIGTGP